MLQNASFMFDLSVFEIFAALISGGCVCILSDAERSAGELGIAVGVMQANFLFLTPTMAELLEPEDFPSLQRLVLGGEAPRRQILERWMSRRNDISLFHAYGPAEAGFVSCCNSSVSQTIHLILGDLSRVIYSLLIYHISRGSPLSALSASL